MSCRFSIMVKFALGENLNMSYYVFSQLLDDLDSLYKKIVVQNSSEGRIMSRREICEIIANSPAPRLYLTPERARKLTFNFDKYRAPASSHKRGKAAMHAEFYRRYLELPKEMRSMTNIERIIGEPAPSFYLSAHRINKLLYKVYDRRK